MLQNPECRFTNLEFRRLKVSMRFPTGQVKVILIHNCVLPYFGVSSVRPYIFRTISLNIRTGPKLGNAAPPKIIFRGPLKFFSWMVIRKSETRRGDAKLGGSETMSPQKILRNLTLFWRLFVRFEPLKFLSFNMV